MSYLVGIDLGSTSIKTVVYDPSGKAVARASRPTERFFPDADHPQWSVWKPEQIWGGVCESLREAIGKLADPQEIRGVAVTGMGMDGLPLAADGTWLYPLISWHCPRTEPQHQRWLEKIGAQRQFAVGGNQIWVFNTALRLQWIEENEPAILEKAHKWLLIEDFVNFMLAGVWATDYSMASTTLLFDQRARAWSDELLALSGVDRRLLCDPLSSGTVLGEVHAQAAEATGLPRGTPVVLGGHDYCCGALPSGAFRPGVLLSVAGTWEMVVAAIPTPVLTPEVREMGILVDSHVASGMWTAMGATVAAEMLEWYRREFGSGPNEPGDTAGDEWEALMTIAAASPPGARGVMFLPHVSGSHCPVVDHRSRGAWVGLRNTTNQGDLLRAMIEGLDYQFLDVVRGFQSAVGVEPERVVVIGGAINNHFWMQNKADVLNKPIETPELDEAVPLGAAILAGIGTGVYRDVNDAFEQVFRPGRVYEPDSNRAAQYAERYSIFARLYPALCDVSARLYGLA